jgi:hypothetical protein
MTERETMEFTIDFTALQQKFAAKTWTERR